MRPPKAKSWRDLSSYYVDIIFLCKPHSLSLYLSICFSLLSWRTLGMLAFFPFSLYPLSDLPSTFLPLILSYNYFSTYLPTTVDFLSQSLWWMSIIIPCLDSVWGFPTYSIFFKKEKN